MESLHFNLACSCLICGLKSIVIGSHGFDSAYVCVTTIPQPRFSKFVVQLKSLLPRRRHGCVDGRERIFLQFSILSGFLFVSVWHLWSGDEVSRVPYDAQPPAEAATSEICGKFAFKTFSMPHKCAHRSLSTWGRHFVYGRFKTGYK